MLFFDRFKKVPKEWEAAYDKLKNSDFAKYYFLKIPRRCALDKILWIEADVIENNIVKSMRINYYSTTRFENVDVKISFLKNGHNNVTIDKFNNLMMFLAVAYGTGKFIYHVRSSEGYKIGTLYNKKYAKKVLSI